MQNILKYLLGEPAKVKVILIFKKLFWRKSSDLVMNILSIYFITVNIGYGYQFDRNLARIVFNQKRFSTID